MRLVQATEAMERERDRATWAAWGGALPLPAYLALVLRLRNHPWPRAAMATWVLCSDEGRPLASCQAYRMDSRLGAAAGHAYGIGSVFTEPALRGRGLASTLLDRLADHLTGTDPAAQACVLFTEAGVGPYLRAGFQDRPLRTLAFAARTGDPGQGIEALLPETDLDAVLADRSWPDGAFAIRPSGAQLDWQVARERILLDVLDRPGPPARGARAGRGLVLWTVDPHRQGLALLLFQATTPEEAQALLEAARRMASACALPRALLWEGPEGNPWHPLPAGVGEASPGGPRPMLRPLHPALQATDWSPIPEALRI